MICTSATMNRTYASALGMMPSSSFTYEDIRVGSYPCQLTSRVQKSRLPYMAARLARCCAAELADGSRFSGAEGSVYSPFG